jgi:hypothetical protein
VASKLFDVKKTGNLNKAQIVEPTQKESRRLNKMENAKKSANLKSYLKTFQ